MIPPLPTLLLLVLASVAQAQVGPQAALLPACIVRHAFSITHRVTYTLIREIYRRICMIASMLRPCNS
jgi:hypothetical protein